MYRSREEKNPPQDFDRDPAVSHCSVWFIMAKHILHNAGQKPVELEEVSSSLDTRRVNCMQ